MDWRPRLQRTALEFEIDSTDAGAFLRPFGVSPGLLKGGKANLNGSLAVQATTTID